MRNYLYKDNSARIYMLFKFYRTAIKDNTQNVKNDSKLFSKLITERDSAFIYM